MLRYDCACLIHALVLCMPVEGEFACLVYFLRGSTAQPRASQVRSKLNVCLSVCIGSVPSWNVCLPVGTLRLMKWGRQFIYRWKHIHIIHTWIYMYWKQILNLEYTRTELRVPVLPGYQVPVRYYTSSTGIPFVPVLEINRAASVFVHIPVPVLKFQWH